MTKFAIQIENQFGYNWNEIQEIVQKTEENGYHSFYVCDHFFLNKDAVDLDTHESWTILTAAAMMTENIRLGTLVTGNNYRHPSLLAKIATSLDHISSGRMEFGIGAGWKEVEYEAYGYDFPSVSERMEMLDETLQIIKKLWNEEKTTFDGKHYQLKDAPFAPKPFQDDPMILIGGAGERKTLKMVAKYADYCNLPFTPMDQIDRKLDALKGHCEKLGRNYEDVGKSIFVPMWVGEHDGEVERYLKERAERSSLSLEDLKKRLREPNFPGSWIGTPEELRKRIDFLNEKGFDYYFTQMPFDRSTDQIEKLSKLVFQKYFK